MTLHIAIAIGLLMGLGTGLAASVTGSPELNAFVTHLSPIGTAFLLLIKMIVIPIVTTTIFSGVAGLGDVRRLGRLGSIMLAFFWSTTLIGILIGMGAMTLANNLFTVPVDLASGAALAGSTAETARNLPGVVDFILSLIPSNPVGAAAEGNLLQLIVFVALFGAAAGTLPGEHRQRLIDLADTVTRALIRLVHWVLLAAPVGVFALSAPVMATSGVAMLQNIAAFIVAIAGGLTVFVFLVYLPAVGLIGRTGVLRFLRASLGAQAVAASTTSSAATLPVALEAAQEKLGLPVAVSSLVVSVGSSLNRGGSALFQGAAIVFLGRLYGVPIGLTALAGAVLATFFVSLTVASVPSASVITLTPALGAVGVPLDGLAVLLGIDRIPDMLRTATNVTGHIAGAAVVARFDEEEEEEYEDQSGRGLPETINETNQPDFSQLRSSRAAGPGPAAPPPIPPRRTEPRKMD